MTGLNLGLLHYLNQDTSAWTAYMLLCPLQEMRAANVVHFDIKETTSCWNLLLDAASRISGRRLHAIRLLEYFLQTLEKAKSSPTLMLTQQSGEATSCKPQLLSLSL